MTAQPNLLTDLLSRRDWLLLDGATGTNLFAMGLMSGDAPELWNVYEPEKIRALYNGFIEAGSDLILTNSFGGSRYRLKLHDAQDRVVELNRAAAVLAR
ncbi:MAG: homocysteine S-methyltransferase family protein, partial [Pseudomonadota bacterium]